MIEAELSTISSFCDRTKTEIRLGNMEGATRARKEAQKGIATVKELVAKLTHDRVLRDTALARLSELEDRLGRFEEAA